MSHRTQSAPHHRPLWPELPLSLFWRTFFFVSILLVGGVLTWLQILRALETMPRMQRAAEKVVTLTQFAHQTLAHMPQSQRNAFLASPHNQLSDIRILRRTGHEALADLPPVPHLPLWTHVLYEELGADTILAGSVDGRQGIWVSFTLDDAAYWMHLQHPLSLINTDDIFFVWAMAALALALVGSAALAQSIHCPLQQLSQAMDRIDRGEFSAARLNEQQSTQEVAHVYGSFNRMAGRLEQIENDRQLMLAGISHDLRTPLTRLRLEVEVSVADEQTRTFMAADIEQMDSIINKFLEYSRASASSARQRLNLADVLAECTRGATRSHPALRIHTTVSPLLHVLGDATELKRVINNLIENACHYGKTPGSDQTHLDITLEWSEHSPRTATLIVRDHGPGVPEQHLHQLTEPFFRLDASRQRAEGVGLGLCIVERIIARMGGRLTLANAAQGTGLQVRLELPVDLPVTSA